MYNNCVDRVLRLGLAAAVALVLPAALSGVQAANPLGIYAGGAFGQARVDASLPTTGQFSEDHSSYKIMVGLRPIGVLGAELAYVDFGHPVRTNGGVVTPEAALSDVTMKGETAFGMFYLPVPVVDVYAKAGLARLQSTAGVCCPEFPTASRTNTSWAGGAGVQYKLGAFGVRGEYERFNAAGGNPHLLSLGATWTF
jgi:opacity protein-like surface antigen